jgi:hypothetical protein
LEGVAPATPSCLHGETRGVAGATPSSHGIFTGRVGESRTWVECDSEVGRHLPDPPATIDVILRTSPDAARRTTDLYQIWNGQLIFPAVPVYQATGTSP